MWKRIDEQLAQSDKHSKLSFNALRVWLWMLPHADVKGRFSADPRLVKAQCMPLLEVRLEQVEQALAELNDASLIHLYDAGPVKRYLVYHDHDQWNPAKNLKFQKPKYPAPPTSICACLSSNGVGTALPTSLSTSSSSKSGPTAMERLPSGHVMSLSEGGVGGGSAGEVMLTPAYVHAVMSPEGARKALEAARLTGTKFSDDLTAALQERAKSEA